MTENPTRKGFSREKGASSGRIACSGQDIPYEDRDPEEEMDAWGSLERRNEGFKVNVSTTGKDVEEGEVRVYPWLSMANREELQTEAAEDETLNKQSVINRLLRGTFNLLEGNLLHSLVIEIGYELNTFEANILVHMYGKFGALEDAHAVFDSMHQHDVASWNAIMSAYMHHRCYPEALELFANMQQEGFVPDKITVKVALRTCAGLAALTEGRTIHHFAAGNGMELEIDVGTALVHMYGKCGALKEARVLFDSMLERNEYTWTAMIIASFKQGHDQDALELYKQMLQDGLLPNKIILTTVLEACTNLPDLAQGEMIHKYIDQSAFACDVELASGLIAMYGKCKALHIACSVFENIRPQMAASYNAMIAVYLTQEHHKKALELFQRMLEDGMKPDAVTYSYVAQSCACIAALEDGRVIHSCIVKDGFDANVMVETALINMYGKCGETAAARLIFDQMKQRSVITWNALIVACAHHGQSLESIQLFKKMQQEGFYPSKATFSSVLPACAHLRAVEEGKMIHACIVKSGLETDAVMGSSLINMYGKCGALKDARSVLDKTRNANVIHWTSMIAVYVQQGQAADAIQLFHQMQQESLKPNNVTFTNVLNACASLGALREGQGVHACIADSELESDAGLGNALLHMYSKCGAIRDARLVFDNMFPKKLVSWNVLIAAYTQHGCGEVAIQLFQQMQQESIVPDEITFVNVLSACSSPNVLKEGKAIHCYVVQRGFDSIIVVATSLISMYGKCGTLEESHCVFKEIEKHNVVSWTAIITACVQQGCGHEAIKLFQKMKLAGLEPDGITLVSVLGAFANLEILAEDEVIQACYKCNFESDVLLGNALINMYGKCGAVEDARSVFDRMHERNVATWNAMICTYGQHGYGREALLLLQRTSEEGISPDELTWIYCLSVCASLGALGQGKSIHKCIVVCGYESNTGVGNALINMYGKCGASEEAFSVFNNIQRDVVSWNSVLAAYSQHGHAKKAVQLFEQMQLESTKPDEVTFLSVLSACSHAGLVDEGCEFFIHMTEDHRMVPTVGHYGSLVDIFGKSGLLNVAEDLIYSMPVHATALVWITLLSACRSHSDIKRGERALDYVSRLDPHNGAPYVLLSNIYATHGRWDDVKTLRKLMLKRGVQKRPGCSMIEVNNEVHSFFPRDTYHSDRKAIYRKLDSLNRQLEEQGYVPDTKLALHDVDEERKKVLLCHHSERLALSFGLISTPSKAPLLIVKNLRMCADCHSAFKFLSTIVDREITLRDASRFHCFNHGVCSCGDYW